MNGPKKGLEKDEAKAGEWDVSIEVCRGEEWVVGVVAVIVGCSSQEDAVEGAVDTFQ